MTIVATTLIHPNPGAAWDDIQKQLKRASGLARKHGAENVTVMVNWSEVRAPTPSAS